MKIPNFLLPGAKTKIRDWLLQFMPTQGDRYGEPFAGRANVFWLTATELGFKRWYLNDPVTGDWLNALSRVVAMGEHSLPATMNREVYDEVKAGEYGEDIKAVLASEITAYGIGYERSALIADKIDSYDCHKLYRKLQRAAQILESRWTTVTKKGFDRLDWWETWGPEDFIYVDPPYYGTGDIGAYRNIDHVALLARLKQTKARWILSGYPNRYYASRLGAPTATLDVSGAMGEYRREWGGNMVSDKEEGNRRIEAIWTNRKE